MSMTLILITVLIMTTHIQMIYMDVKHYYKLNTEKRSQEKRLVSVMKLRLLGKPFDPIIMQTECSFYGRNYYVDCL